LAKIRLSILRLWAHSTDFSGAVGLYDQLACNNKWTWLSRSHLTADSLHKLVPE